MALQYRAKNLRTSKIRLSGTSGMSRADKQRARREIRQYKEEKRRTIYHYLFLVTTLLRWIPVVKTYGYLFFHNKGKGRVGERLYRNGALIKEARITANELQILVTAVRKEPRSEENPTPALS